MFAESSSLGLAVLLPGAVVVGTADDAGGWVGFVVVVVVVEGVLLSMVASFVNLSEILFNCSRLGRIMWTSGSRHVGSCNPSTADSWRTFTGTSCDITVSRSLGPVPLLFPSSGKRPSNPSSLLIPIAFEPVVQLEERIVNANKGTLPFFVSRICAEFAPFADRSARCSAPMGTSRFITPELDSSVYVLGSKIASCVYQPISGLRFRNCSFLGTGG